MATRFAIGFYALVALAVLVLAACGGSDDSSNSTPTPTLSLVATPTQTVSSVGGPCLGELPDGSVAIVGRVIDISRSDASVAPGFESMFVTVAVDAATSAADVGESYESGDALQVVLLGNLITEVDLGDCVAAAGETQRWACGPDCDAVGFVASFFEVLSTDSDPPAGAVCQSDLPDGAVALTGLVESVGLRIEDPVFRSTEVSIRITESLVTDDTRVDKRDFEPGDVVEVIVLGEVVAARDGDCVRVAGQVRRYACGPACDAAGFVASFFEVLSAE